MTSSTAMPLRYRRPARTDARAGNRFVGFFGLVPALIAGLAATAAPHVRAAGCLTDCTPRIGIVSAFGQEADILVARTSARQSYTVNGNRFTTGMLAGNAVVIVLSGVSIVNSTMVTQLMIDHFKVERLVMSGIAGGVDPSHHVGDVTVPDRWAMPAEVYWNRDASVPAPCGSAGDVSCLGLKLHAGPDGRPLPSFMLPGGVATGLFMRDTFAMNDGNAPQGEYRFDYEVDPQMLAVARGIAPALERCGPKARATPAASPDPKLCVRTQPRLIVGGRGVSAPIFLANAAYRSYLFETVQAQTFEMETAALAHVAYANRIPYIAFRSLSDLAGGEEFNADVGALFASGLAETNEAAVSIAFLEAWARRDVSATPTTSTSTSTSTTTTTATSSTTASGPFPPAPVPPSGSSPPRALKVLIITMFEPESEPWIGPLTLDQKLPVAGLLPESPALRCNGDDVCLLTAGMGHANAAASTLAVALDPQFDLRRTYFLVAGIAGIDPARGTLGTATWARWLVDAGIAHEIDAREMPRGWASGYFGIMAAGPGVKPKLDYRTEVAQLDEALLQKALALSRDAPLADGDRARAYRAHYTKAPANRPPRVTQCDTLSGDTWWHGDRLGAHARAWTKLLTDGRGTYCTTQQEDNATYNALMRAAAAGKLDSKRLAVLRTASNFDRPYSGQNARDSLKASTNGVTGGFVPATKNLYLAGSPLVRDIVAHWPQWREGVPPR